MAKPFLRTVAEYIFDRHKDTMESLCIVLPSKRAATFLKSHLAQCFDKAIWVPPIITAEELVAELSGLQAAEEVDLICSLYESYVQVYGPGAESFESFVKWGSLILQDFNEIDRYLADPEQLYENLKDIKVIENWSLGAEELSEHQKNYLHFMASLGKIYKHYTAHLLSQKKGYQGLMYRVAVDNLKNHTYIERHGTFLFCGFNAFNEAELRITKTLKDLGKAEFIWDADRYYLDNAEQEAGVFLRNNFKHLEIKEPIEINSFLTTSKQIEVITVPKQIGQAQVVKQSLEKLLKAGVTMDRVALVLANEKLLWPVLQLLPDGIEHVNITMEYPLRYTTSYNLLDQLINLQVQFSRQQRKHKQIYHSDLIKLLRNPLYNELLLREKSPVKASYLLSELKRRNLSFINAAQLVELFGSADSLCIKLLFEQSTQNLTNLILELLQALNESLQKRISNAQSRLELEYLHVLLKHFNKLTGLIEVYPYFKEIQNFKQLYQQIVGSATAPFIGEPLRGLQVMGVLETRTLDFDYVLLVNVNEGVLPSGKTSSSFIPNDLKRAFGLPLYLQKDAIYAYHFYRLLQRASEITITCDSDTDAFGKGEQSRFVTQLQLELAKHPNIHYSESVANYRAMPVKQHSTIAVTKTPEVLIPLLEKALSNEDKKGLSPSALIQFKECPLRFYYRYSAGLKEIEKIEESAEASTLGSILHWCLEHLYQDAIGKALTEDFLTAALAAIPSFVEKAFTENFGQRIHSGKLALQQEVVKVYVEKLIRQDLDLVRELKKEKSELQLLALEQELSASLQVEIAGKNEIVYVKGKADRIDRLNHKIRIVDYKSSIKTNDSFSFTEMNLLFTDVRYNKQLQLLLYAWMYYKNNPNQVTLLEPCIIPFKKFGEPKYIKLGKEKISLPFTKELFVDFETALSKFIAGIFSSDISFLQTDDEDMHQYCAYSSICGFAAAD